MITGFEFNGTPILIDDVLITSIGYQNSLSKSNLYNELRQKEVRQKIVKIADNCVLGWAGNLETANIIYRKLRDHFAGNAYSLKRVEQFLTRREMKSGIQKIELIGWVVERSRMSGRRNHRNIE
jgi:hypothetical protein